jgi:hypothetical protein
MDQLLKLLDKHINQEALAKDLALVYVLPMIEKAVEGVDIIPGTDIDQAVIKQVVEFIKAQVK